MQNERIIINTNLNESRQSKSAKDKKNSSPVATVIWSYPSLLPLQLIHRNTERDQLFTGIKPQGRACRRHGCSPESKPHKHQFGGAPVLVEKLSRASLKSESAELLTLLKMIVKTFIQPLLPPLCPALRKLMSGVTGEVMNGWKADRRRQAAE